MLDSQIDKSLPQRQEELEKLIQQMLEEARRQGATAADAGISMDKGLTVTVRMGKVETIEHHQDRGLGLTVYFGQRQGSASTSDFNQAAIKSAVASACTIAKYTADDPCLGLPDQAELAFKYPHLDLYHPWQLTAEQAIDIALRCENAARAHDARITNSEGATVTVHEGLHVQGNSSGFIGGYPSSRHSVSCSVIAQDGDSMQRDFWYTMARDATELDNVEEVGRIAARRVLQRLNGRKIATQTLPVLFHADMAAGLIGSFIGAIRGGSQYRKTSFLLDSLGQAIFPAWLNIEEKPHIPKALGSSPFDREGVRTVDRNIIQAGVLQSYLLDSYSARRLGLKTTGHAGGVHNLLVGHHAKTYQELIRDMGTGLLVTELMGQGINRVTGDYSRGASGFWVEGGEIQYPVEEVTIAGNLKDMFQSIQSIANDIDIKRNIRCGSLLIDHMTVAGH